MIYEELVIDYYKYKRVEMVNSVKKKMIPLGPFYGTIFPLV